MPFSIQNQFQSTHANFKDTLARTCNELFLCIIVRNVFWFHMKNSKQRYLYNIELVIEIIAFRFIEYRMTK